MRLHRRVVSRNFLLGILILSLTVSACSTSSGGGPWTAPDPPDGGGSGLTIGYLPNGFSFVWNEGHETATFHVFQREDGEELAVGRTISPRPSPSVGEEVTREGRRFTLLESDNETRVLEELASLVRVEVVSRSLDADTLLRIAESVSYNATRDSQA